MLLSNHRTTVQTINTVVSDIVIQHHKPATVYVRIQG